MFQCLSRAIINPRRTTPLVSAQAETREFREGFRKYFKAGFARPLPPTTHLDDSDALEAVLPRENRPSDARSRGRHRRQVKAANEVDPGVEESSDEDE